MKKNVIESCERKVASCHRPTAVSKCVSVAHLHDVNSIDGGMTNMKAVNAHSDTHLETFCRLHYLWPLAIAERVTFMLCLFYDIIFYLNKENFYQLFFASFFFLLISRNKTTEFILFLISLFCSIFSNLF